MSGAYQQRGEAIGGHGGFDTGTGFGGRVPEINMCLLFACLQTCCCSVGKEAPAPVPESQEFCRWATWPRSSNASLSLHRIGGGRHRHRQLAWTSEQAAAQLNGGRPAGKEGGGKVKIEVLLSGGDAVLQVLRRREAGVGSRPPRGAG